LTQLVRALSEQAPTTTPSAPAVASEHRVTEKAGSPGQDSVQTVQAPAPAPAPDINADVMRAVAAQIESYLRANGRELQFSVDQETGRTVITVRDPSTGEVIRQIPDIEAVRIAQALGQQPNALIDVLI
jgi:flagellar protein FlaG